MKKLTRILLIFNLSIISLIIFAQTDCKVLKAEIADSYSGNCKKGLAHGKGIASGTDTYEGQFKKGLPNGQGTYTWATGETYVGNWKEGLRHGEGIFTYTIDENVVVMDGIWADDQYVGVELPKPRVLYQSNVDRFSFQRTGDIKDRVLVDLFQNGTRNVGVENYMLATSSGYDTRLGYSRGFEGIVFPVIIKVSYTTRNKLKTYKYNVVFEFKISEPGDWRVELHN
jgi:hypothetical protein